HALDHEALGAVARDEAGVRLEERSIGWHPRDVEVALAASATQGIAHHLHRGIRCRRGVLALERAEGFLVGLEAQRLNQRRRGLGDWMHAAERPDIDQPERLRSKPLLEPRASERRRAGEAVERKALANAEHQLAKP